MTNVLASLTTSAVALTLGAALGLLSGRGAFAGMISAGIFPIIACGLGGTRVKVSGPTAPMSALMAVVVAHVASDPVHSDAFVSTVLYETAALLVLAGLLRTGKFIELVPRVVVSGFMTGIGILVWMSQVEAVIGPDWSAPNWATLTITAVSLVVIVLTGRLLERVPGPLMALVVIPPLAYAIPASIGSIPTVQLPEANALAIFVPDLSAGALIGALPFALQLTFLCYLDTLLTSLVIDIVTEEKSHRNKELAAQGAATAAVALVGGIPGAQATIRSYMIVKEGATQRYAGVLVGVFVLIELFALKGVIGFMPEALFAGILLKVGYDVIDWKPMHTYLRQHRLRSPVPLAKKGVVNPLESTKFQEPYVGHLELAIILSTALITVLIDLNVAVFVFTLLFFLFRLFHVVVDIKPLKLAGSREVAVVGLHDPLTVERLGGLHKRLERRHHYPRVIILDFKAVKKLGDTGGLAVKTSVALMRDRGSEILLAELTAPTRALLSALGTIDDVGALNVFRTVSRAMMYAELRLEDIGAQQARTDSCLSHDLIFLDPPISTKEELFKFAATAAAEAGYARNARDFHRDLLFSEEKGSTGLEKGVALPHCRSNAVDSSFAMYIRLEVPLEGYATLDDSAVRHVFVVGGTSDAAVYLQLLSRLAQAIHGKGSLEELESAETAGEILACLSLGSNAPDSGPNEQLGLSEDGA